MYKLYQKEEVLLIVVFSAIGGLLLYLTQPEFTGVIAYIGMGFLVPLAAKLWSFTINLAFSGAKPGSEVISELFGTISDSNEEYNNSSFFIKLKRALVILLINTLKGTWYFILFGIGTLAYELIKNNN
jgi:hypothetical protein